jgi:exodeoxyribonuclease V beta subunit
VAQLRLESDRNLVQIVTIHKSKGLEYGIVFCPFLWDGHQSRAFGELEGKEYHDDDGLPVIDFRPELAGRGGRDQRRRREEKDAEFMRLLYVALTRAAYRCYLVAGCYATPDLRPSHRWPRAIAACSTGWSPARTSRYADWLAHQRPPEAIEEAWQALADGGTPLSLRDLPSERRRRSPAPPVASEPERADRHPQHRCPAGESAASAACSMAPRTKLRRATTMAAPACRRPRRRRQRKSRGTTSSTSRAVRTPAIACMRSSSASTSPIRAAGQRSSTRSGQPSAVAARTAGWRIRRPAGAHAAPTARRRAATVLPGGIVLSSVPRRQRLVELGVQPARRRSDRSGSTAGCRRRATRCRGSPLRPLGLPQGLHRPGLLPRRPLLRARLEIEPSRFTAADYGEQPMATAMAEHGYHLQYLLYCVALHRYLRTRIADYAYDRHFGGVLYLFVRGVRPGWQW